jgi:hypothetical protein
MDAVKFHLQFDYLKNITSTYFKLTRSVKNSIEYKISTIKFLYKAFI